MQTEFSRNGISLTSECTVGESCQLEQAKTN